MGYSNTHSHTSKRQTDLFLGYFIQIVTVTVNGREIEMSLEQKKRSGHLSACQKMALIDFVEENPRVKEARYDTSFTYKDGNRLWEKAALALNAIPGSQKDWKAWRKVSILI